MNNSNSNNQSHFDTLWKPVPDTQERYHAHPQGLVRGPSGKVLSSKYRDPEGYPRVSLSMPQANGKSKSIGRRLHSIIAQTFMGPAPVGLVCDHVNGDKTDNRVSNLNYVTQADNLRKRNSPNKLKPLSMNQLRIMREGLERGISIRQVARMASCSSWSVQLMKKQLFD